MNAEKEQKKRRKEKRRKYTNWRIKHFL